MEIQKHKKVLIIEKNVDLLKIIEGALKDSGIQCITAQGEYEALQLLGLEQCDLVIMDEDTSLISPEETIRLIRDVHPNIPLILLLEPQARRRVARETLLSGWLDYLPKPLNLEILLEKIFNNLHSEDIHREVTELRGKLQKRYGFNNIIGRCSKMEQVFQAIEKIANSDITVFIRGESGTGKELIAREIHRQSARRNKPFIPINCAAIPESLLESELFGHEKGAFTGAAAQRKGKFEIANTGTLFLDEIGEMSLLLQAKILRIIEGQEFERVGGNDTLKVDVRIITATNKDLLEEVKLGKFRKDLYYRINVYPIYLPSLRERKEDIPLLVSYFIEKIAQKNKREVHSITPRALKVLVDYSWQGNVRELENVIERAILICPGKELDAPQFSLTPLEEISTEPKSLSPVHDVIIEPPNVPFSNETIVPLKDVERKYLEHVLQATQGNISRAAQQLRISRSTLYRKLEKYKLIEPL